MKLKILLLIILFMFAVKISVLAQTEDVKQMWSAQIDTNHINPLKPEYLHIETDKVIEMYNKQPNFGMYKDNYFITGVPMNKPITNQTADAKFQISIRQRLFSTLMPFNTQPMLIYTQK